MSTLYVMCGLPGSGKSTLAAKLPGVVISSDAIRKELFGDESVQKNPKLVFSIMHTRVLEELKHGDVIYDATNLTVRTRRSVLALASDKAVCIYMDVPFGECMERNIARERIVPDSAMQRMNRSFERPTLEEGWTEILSSSQMQL